jgi:uncharacterized membrane protein
MASGIVASTFPPRQLRAERSGAGSETHRPGRNRLLPWGLAGLFFVLYSLFCLRRHDAMLTTGYDLGIFEQAVRGYAHFQAPVTPLKGDGYNLLGDHFSPVLAVLVPLYWVWPSADTLLIAQAALLALPIVPIGRWAQQRLGAAPAVAVSTAYGLSWGISSTLGFDFHEVAFAVPLLAFSVVALAERRWVAAVAWAAPLVLVKEDLGVTVAAVGGYVAWRGARRLGLATAAFGLLASVLELFVLLPAMSPSHSYGYWDNLHHEPGTGGGTLHRLLTLPLHLVTPLAKDHLLLAVLAPTLLLALRSPLLLVAAPTLGWRLLTKNPMYWSLQYHYSAVLMPIVFAAFVDALIRLRGAERRALRMLPGPVLCASLAVTVAMVPHFPLAQADDLGFWRSSDHVRTVRSVLDDIPSGARVAAGNRLVPQLTNRCTVIEFGWPQDWRTADWIVLDEQYPMGWPISGQQEQKEIAAARASGYRTVRDEQGIVLLHRSGPTP